MKQQQQQQQQRQRQQQLQRRTTTTMTTVLMTMTFLIKLAQENPSFPYLVSGSCPLSGSRHHK